MARSVTLLHKVSMIWGLLPTLVPSGMSLAMVLTMMPMKMLAKGMLIRPRRRHLPTRRLMFLATLHRNLGDLPHPLRVLD